MRAAIEWLEESRRNSSEAVQFDQAGTGRLSRTEARLSIGTRAERLEDAAWSLSDPIGEAQRIGDAVCFYPGKAAIEVDGERLGNGAGT